MDLAGGSGLLLVTLPAENEQLFGAPVAMIRILSIFALGMSAHSFVSFLVRIEDMYQKVRDLIMLNLAYCISIFIMLYAFNAELSFIGFLYFFCEIAVIGGLMTVEFQLLRRSE